GVTHDTDNNTGGVSATTPKATPVTSCPDTNNCTIDTCDPTVHGSAACIHTPIICDDNNGCTSDTCNPATGQCVFTPDPPCDDSNGCTTDTCNPANGQCVFAAEGPCDDTTRCTADCCNSAHGPSE